MVGPRERERQMWVLIVESWIWTSVTRLGSDRECTYNALKNSIIEELHEKNNGLQTQNYLPTPHLFFSLSLSFSPSLPLCQLEDGASVVHLTVHWMKKQENYVLGLSLSLYLRLWLSYFTSWGFIFLRSKAELVILPASQRHGRDL